MMSVENADMQLHMGHNIVKVRTATLVNGTEIFRLQVHSAAKRCQSHKLHTALSMPHLPADQQVNRVRCHIYPIVGEFSLL